MDIVNWHKRNDMIPLKVGDYVRVRKDLSTEKNYGSVKVVPNMLCFRGIVSRVSKVHKDSYELLGMVHSIRYRWSKDMLQRVSKEDMEQNKVLLPYDKVKIISNFAEVAHEDDDLDRDDAEDMEEYAGMVACITNINIYRGEITDYELDVDDGENWWPSQYVQRITDEEWLKETSANMRKGRPASMVPGTLVKIREDLKTGKRYGELSVHREMTKFVGMKAFVEVVDNDNTFRLTDTHDKGNFWWTPEMLEVIE